MSTKQSKQFHWSWVLSFSSHSITNWTKSQQWSHWFLLWTHWSQRVAAGFALLPWDSVGCNVIVFVHIHGGIHLNIAVPLRTALLLKGTLVESTDWGGLMIFFAFFCYPCENGKLSRTKWFLPEFGHDKPLKDHLYPSRVWASRQTCQRLIFLHQVRAVVQQLS